MFFNLIGGLGLFLYGMVLMSEGLQKAAGDKMRRILEVLTTTPVRGVLVGAIVTGIIQSSSATTVMVVSFVNAGLMNLSQAFGVIMGANIGTTMTAQLIAFRLGSLALPIVGVGFLVYFLAKRKTVKYVGLIALGFGILFVGLNTMSEAMAPLRSNPGFISLMATFGKVPILGVLVGLFMTLIVQSSSATIGMLQAVASQGLISFGSAIPILFGDNIGTCITAVLATVGTNITAKRAAVAHVSFNIFGTVLFLSILPLFRTIVLAITPGSSVTRLIANAHTTFNLLNTIVWIPLVPIMVKWVTFVVRGKTTQDVAPHYLDTHLFHTPAVALGSVTKELGEMGVLAQTMMRDAQSAILDQDVKAIARINEAEVTVDYYQREITVYLTGLGQNSLAPAESNRMMNLMNVAHDLERVGDHVENLAELAEYRIEHKLPFSRAATDELQRILVMVESMYGDTLRALADDDFGLADRVLLLEDEVDGLHKVLRNNHIQRLSDGKCNPQASIIYLDILTNLERIADHSVNVAQAVLDRKDAGGDVPVAGSVGLPLAEN